MNFRILIDQLDKIIDEAKAVPLTGRCMIDKDQVIEILNEMRLHLPDEIKEAKRIIKKRDEIIGNARADAEKILADADKRREYLLDEHQITNDARRMADEICDKADEYDRQMREASRQYADSILSDLQKAVGETMSVINNAYNTTVVAFQESLDKALMPVDRDLGEMRDVLEANRKSISAEE